MIRLAVTGHRPNKLWGYNNNEKYKKLFTEVTRIIKELLDKYGEVYTINGMALGVDQLFGMAAWK